MLPVIAIVGRPNVGKSSLFNRLVGKRFAIESPISGTTRDQISHRLDLRKHRVLLVDTGGIMVDSEETLEADVQAQAQAAIEGADVVLFVVDASEDLTSHDFHAADRLRRSGKPCVMVANKCDHLSRLEEKTFNLYELGFGAPVAVSAIHGTGLGEIEDALENQLEELGFPPQAPVDSEEEIVPGIRLAFVGRPNVGKSSLLNALFGKEKVIVSDIPGTTRDAVEVPFHYEDHPFVLVDTAGLRRRGRIEKGIEKYSVLRSFQAIDDADVVVLVMDGEEGLSAQDLHVCEFVLQQNKGLIVVVNKTDLFESGEDQRNALTHQLRRRMAFVPWAPVVFTSALKRKNIFSILDLAIQIGAERERVVPEERLRVWLEEAVFNHSAAGGHGKQRVKVLSVKQTGVKPPTFVFSVHNPQSMHFSYSRYLENSLREQFGFGGTGIKMIFARNEEAARPRRPQKRSKRGEVLEDF